MVCLEWVRSMGEDGLRGWWERGGGIEGWGWIEE